MLGVRIAHPWVTGYDIAIKGRQSVETKHCHSLIKQQQRRLSINSNS